jgi:hypothetical protein
MVPNRVASLVYFPFEDMRIVDRGARTACGPFRPARRPRSRLVSTWYKQKGQNYLIKSFRPLFSSTAHESKIALSPFAMPILTHGSPDRSGSGTHSRGTTEIRFE